MKVLMLGNSYTSANDLPALLSDLTGWEVAAHTRGGARLAEHLHRDSALGKKTLPALANGHWDYVVLQECSSGPTDHKEAFFRSVRALSEMIRQNGAEPVLLAVWPYREDGKKLLSSGKSYAENAQSLALAYREAGEAFGIAVADAAKLFSEDGDPTSLYREDGSHPSRKGSLLAACAIAETILKLEQTK